ncbi:efflux RND transporter periplasmic adaptor subunit [Bdellovibrio svalbardensis]|uniref:Efflux RND transporter periplasmic adaptor subunit n=1 Tax=Bdellovibrio svalbardensis TaxID=2972972 RepID=A0ABT6DHJ9_9BACT|nr:efflux RND transporter periplasmic adaptor subunit [Bdellovibrio svalbardensis]MDG0816276.1 efflux RND transporter periplasmic adaptor subunit [Bdellovibrio svalbardensis]
MKKQWIALLAASLLLVGFVGYRSFKASNKSDWKSIKPSQAELVIKVTANGSVTPRNKLVVTTPISGRVDRVLVEEGAKVRKGQQVALLSSSDRVALMDSLNQGLDAGEQQRLKDMYRPTPILAPAAGTIVLRAVNQGQSVNTETTLFEISDMLIVISKVDETDIAKVRVGQAVEISIDAYAGHKFAGIVDRIGQQSTVTNNVTTYDVFISPKETFPDNIKSGMSSSVDYLISKKDNALLIPTWLSEGRKNAKMELMIADASGKPQKKEVLLGESNGDSVEVVEGLTSTDELLYKPLTYETETKGAPFSVGGKKSK